MMKDTAWITETVLKNAFGMLEQKTYYWNGKSPYVYVSGLFLDELGVKDTQDSFSVGPYTLLKLERFPEIDNWLCIRSDWQHVWRVPVYRATRWLDWFYRRSIVVMYIYGAADHHAWIIPSWRDIHALKWLAKVVK